MDNVPTANVEAKGSQPVAPWLSVLAPVYNLELYLQEFLESVLLQTDESIEIIAVDDASTDGSMAILREFQARHPEKLTILQHPVNRGLSAARNTMLDAARGTFVWFLDADDVLMPGSVKELKAIVDRENPDLVLFDYCKLRAKIRLKHRLRGELHCRTFSGTADQKLTDRASLVRGLFTMGQMHVWSKVSRRTLWADDLRFPEGKYFEDMAVSPRLAIRARSYYYVPSVWVAYRQREGSIVSTPSLQKLLDRSEALVSFMDEFRRAELNPDAESKFMISHTAARNFIAAAKGTSGLDDTARDARLQLYRSNFMRSIAMSLAELRSGYFKRGWFWRWLRLSHWLEKAAPTRNRS